MWIRVGCQVAVVPAAAVGIVLDFRGLGSSLRALWQRIRWTGKRLERWEAIGGYWVE